MLSTSHQRLELVGPLKSKEISSSRTHWFRTPKKTLRISWLERASNLRFFGVLNGIGSHEKMLDGFFSTMQKEEISSSSFILGTSLC